MKHVVSILFILFFQLSFAQWKYANYPDGGHVLSMTSRQGTLFASVGQDVFRSTDKGENWVYSGNGLPKSDSIFLTVSDNRIFAATRKGLYSSADNGLTWSVLNGIPDSVANRISYITAQGKIILAGAPYGRIYRSADEGLTWKLTYSETFAGTANPILIKDSMVLAGVFNGIVYSKDLGQTWTIAPGLPAIQPVFTFYKTKIIAEFLEDIYISADSGATWDFQPNDLPAQTQGLEMINDDSVLYLGTTKGLFTSVDEGQTWTEVVTSLPYRSCAYTFASLNGIFMGTSKSIFYSSDYGNTWSEKSKGLQRIKAIALASSGNRILSGCGSGMLTSENTNLKWEYELFGLTGNAGVFYFASMDTLIFAATKDDIFVSLDNGENWDDKYNGMFPADMHTTQVKVNAGVLYAPHMADGLYRSMDRGENWKEINGDLPLAASVTKIGFHNSIIFIAVSHQGIYRSLNEGLNWSLANNGLPIPLTINEINTIADAVFLATDKGLYKSADDGLNWSKVMDIPAQPVHCVTRIDKYILAGAVGEIFLSADQGVSWRAVGNGFATTNVNAFALSANIVYAATDWGVWYSNLNEVGIKEDPKQLLVQVYPNPSQGIVYIHSSSHDLNVEVFNSLGEKLVATDLHSFSSELNLTHLPKGVYMVCIHTNDQQVATKKIVIQ